MTQSEQQAAATVTSAATTTAAAAAAGATASDARATADKVAEADSKDAAGGIHIRQLSKDCNNSGADAASSSSKAAFSVGETVFVKRVKSASWHLAKIIAAVVEDPQHEFYGRYQVQFLSTEQAYHVRPSSIKKYHKVSQPRNSTQQQQQQQ